ncbi:MAG TPA: S9 family peptidase [Vicinamibacteria bacterium]|nr:S9 family peptidase [Vicinamibacteria bacterium]
MTRASAFPLALFGGLLLMSTCSTASAAPVPPVAPTKEHSQVWHGKTYLDPYYWLREKGSPDVVRYLEAENAYTEAMTAGLKPFADALYAEMLGRIKQTDLSVPVRRGRFHYYQRTVEGQQYPIRCRKPGAADGSFRAEAAEEVLLDQNEMAKGLPFLSIALVEVSDDDQRLLYATDSTGFRQYQLFVKDLKTGAVQGPLAERVTSATWAADNATVFFTTEHPVTKRSDTLWRLKLGGQALEVREEKDELFTISVGRTKDRKFLVLGSHSTDTWDRSLLSSATPDGEFRLVLPRTKGHKYDVEHRDGVLYIRTNQDARNFRLVTAPVADPGPAHWKPLLEARADVLLEDVEVFRDYLAVQEKTAALNRLRVMDFKTGSWKEVRFPEPVYTAFASGTPEFESTQLRYRYESLITPPSVYDYDMAGGQSVLLKRDEVLGGYDPSRYTSERLWATARDGVRVPISVVYPKGFAGDGKAPLWLYAYGSYGFGTSAGFDSRRLSLLDRGIPFAIAHIRGGNEMGEPWHDDGMLMKKKNTFFDFVDCAQYLVDQKWTQADRLVIEGASAGGLLMGAVTNERPDLFRAVHAGVPFVDVMNTMMDASLPLTVGEYLEWGNPNEKPAFDYMMSYSPYDNLTRKAYPAILVTTSYNDSQVMYWEPAKYVARLRTLKTDGKPLLLKTKMQPAGHGGASGRYDALHDRAFEMAWMLSQVGITK